MNPMLNNVNTFKKCKDLYFSY